MSQCSTWIQFARLSQPQKKSGATYRFNETIWGFQIQPQTRWNPGLTDEMIAQYEVVVGASFDPDFKTFLRCVNGTDLPAIDVRGSSGEPARFAPHSTRTLAISI